MENISMVGLDLANASFGCTAQTINKLLNRRPRRP